MKAWFVRNCPTKVFPSLINAYYILRGKDSRITRSNDAKGWFVNKDGLRLLSPTPKFVGFGLHVFESKFEKLLKIEEGDNALDVGACIGDTTVPMLMKVGAKGKVVAVEPDNTNLTYLYYNTKKYSNIEVIRKALWKEKCKIAFNLHNTPTGHSIQPDKERKTIVEVECDTLDNLFGNMQIDYAKIDVQGSEADVLEGGKNKFLKNIKKLVVETHGWKIPEKRTYPHVLEILSQFDFSLKRTENIVSAWREG